MLYLWHAVRSCPKRKPPITRKATAIRSLNHHCHRALYCHFRTVAITNVHCNKQIYDVAHTMHYIPRTRITLAKPQRSQAALRVEDLVKGLSRKSKDTKDKSILSIIKLLGERFCRSTNANHRWVLCVITWGGQSSSTYPFPDRKGGLIGIAATAIGLGRQIDLVRHTLREACARDSFRAAFVHMACVAYTRARPHSIWRTSSRTL